MSSWNKKICIEHLLEMKDPLEEANQVNMPQNKWQEIKASLEAGQQAT